MEVKLKSQLKRHSANVRNQEMNPWLDVIRTHAHSNGSIIAVLGSSQNHERNCGFAVANAKKLSMKPQKNRTYFTDLKAGGLE